MRLFRTAIFARVIVVTTCFAIAQGNQLTPTAQNPSQAVVHLDRTLGAIDPLLWGHFTEETLSDWEGGVSSEMLADRKFSIPEARQLADPRYGGTGGGWVPIEFASNVMLLQDERVYYSAPMSQRISNAGGSVPAGVQQAGYRLAMPQVARKLASGMMQRGDQKISAPFHFLPGEHYRVRIAIKDGDLNGPVTVAIGQDYKHIIAKHDINLAGGEDWKVYKFDLVSNAEANDAKFMIFTESPGTIWVDSASLVRRDLDEGGLRKDVLEATRRLTPSNVRWPGGWFVSDYHWEDGIGPVDKRTARLNRAWDVIYNNDIGVDEYLAYCRAVGAEPYINVNVGTGTAEEAAALVEYVNGPAISKWGHIRAQNGHPEPYGVRLWGIGNEEYMPGIGGMNGRTYAATYLAFVRVMRKMDPSLKFVAVGLYEMPKGLFPPEHPFHNVVRYATEWGDQFLPVAGHDADYYSVHFYEPGDSMKGDVTLEDFERAAMVIAEDLSQRLESVFKVMEKHQTKIPLALDEWRMSFAEKVPLPAIVGLPASTPITQLGSMGSVLSMIQAVGDAGIYNLMQRRPTVFGLASHTLPYGYLAGLLGLNRDHVVLTPAALMLEMYATHDRCQSLATDVISEKFDVPPKGGFPGVMQAPYIDVSARRHPSGRIDVFLVNRNLTETIRMETATSGGAPPADVEAIVLASEKITDWNTFENPTRVMPRKFTAAAYDGKITIELPPHSVTRLSW